MKHSIICGVLIITAAVAGLFLRLPSFNLRPMHTDEAVHAVKFGELLEDGVYTYDKYEYHGPTLNYSTLVPAALRGEKTFKQLSEFTLRIVPVFFGICLIFLPLILKKGIGRVSACVAVLVTAVSPVMVFYSQYYIQEMLLVCFTLGMIGCLYKFFQSKKVGWAVPGGAFLGLMHATKETFVIAVAAMAGAAFLVFVTAKKNERSSWMSLITIKSAGLFLFSAAVVSVVLFSSFFTNPQGIADSVMTYMTYFGRATGDGVHADGVHAHPWYYYFHWLMFFSVPGGVVFTEAFVVLAAGVGIVLAFTRRGVENKNKYLLRFFAFYTILMALVYSAIPYKTPWCLLGFYSGMIILAGFAAEFLMTSVSAKKIRVITALLLAAALVHLAYLSVLANTKYAASPANPWVYAHTTEDIYKVTAEIKETVFAAADSREAAFDMPVQVVCPGDDYWPLPWYLREFNNVGYWSGIGPELPASDLMIISAETAGGVIDVLERQLISHLFNSQPAGKKSLYLPLFNEYLELRPMVAIRGYVTKEVWDRAKSASTEIETEQVLNRRKAVMENENESKTLKMPDVIASAGRFRTEAMATFFEALIVHPDQKYARQAAFAAFGMIDKLEQELSRYIENSDVSRINNLKAGQSVTVSPETFECLEIAQDMYRQTGGAFDVTIGALYNCWLDDKKKLKDPSPAQIEAAMEQTGMDAIELNPDELTVTVTKDGISIDLGGVGKGYALDKAVEVLKDWSIYTAFVHCGGSTIVATGKPEDTDGWPITMSLHEKLYKKIDEESGETGKIDVIKRMNMYQTTLSGSNLEYGSHVIDPETGRPVKRNFAAWAMAPSGAVADALSTSMLVMKPLQAEEYFKANPEQRGIAVSPVQPDSYEMHFYGSEWP